MPPILTVAKIYCVKALLALTLVLFKLGKIYNELYFL